MKEGIIIASITALIIGIVIGVFIIGSNNSNSKTINEVFKNPFGFEIWNSSDIKQVSFVITKSKYVGMSSTDCLDYLRANYENPVNWRKYKYQCILDGVSSNLEDLTKAQSSTWWDDFNLTGSCRCEYN